MTETHEHWHKRERKYADVSPDLLPVTESLQDVLDRARPVWESLILPDLMNGRNVMVVAHTNSLRSIIQAIDSLTIEQIQVIDT
jgi:2,3-bisphosphoglycerate-dependent phosphoglycerate mutase